MLLTTFILFAITALLGVSMVGIRETSGHNPPAWLTMTHGLPAAAGLTLLLYATFAFGVPRLAIIALILFLVAAGGGAALNLVYQQRGQLLPRGLMYLHLLLAVCGFVLLAVDVFA
jgi:ABC-type transport system involved in cytochrome c biogenesis permease subunit